MTAKILRRRHDRLVATIASALVLGWCTRLRAAQPQDAPTDAPPAIASQGQENPQGAPTNDSTATPRTPTPVVLSTAELPPDAMLKGLALRLPGRDVIAVEQPRPAGPIAFVWVRKEADQLLLTLIMPGGFAYDRVVSDVPNQSVRAAVGALVTLLDAVEAGRAVPSRTNVAIPEPGPEPEPQPQPQPEPEPEPEPKPEPESEPQPQPQPSARAQLGVTATPALGLGLLPRQQGSILLGGGGSLGLDLRAVSGWLATLEMRVLGRSAGPVSLSRLRVAFGGGYGWRWRALELNLAAVGFVEPWWVRRAGSAAPILNSTATASRRPLLGGAVRASPGLFVSSKRASGPMFRLGPRIELAGGFVPQDGARSVRLAIEDATGAATEHFRLGGLELSLGLEATIWFGVGPR